MPTSIKVIQLSNKDLQIFMQIIPSIDDPDKERIFVAI